MRVVAAAAVAFVLGVGAGWALLAKGDAASAPPAAVTRAPSAHSLFFVPFYGAYTTERGRAAGRLVASAIRDGDDAACARAIEEYRELEATENFAGEYSSLRWTCEYRLADEATRAAMLAETREARRFERFFWREDFSRLAGYIDQKYGDRAPKGGQFTFLDEFVRFNAPLREKWEKTEALMDWLEVREGEVVADIGAGAGFYTWRFADRVGPSGKVYALELNQQHLGYMGEVVRGEGLSNVEVRESTTTATGLEPGSVDVAFLCLIYQAVYGTVGPEERAAFIEDVKRTLKPGGRLVVIENAPADELPAGTPTFRGFSISRELVIPQLEAYGFRLARETYYVPQRYALVFESTGE
jgi:predicted methyltransferase